MLPAGPGVCGKVGAKSRKGTSKWSRPGEDRRRAYCALRLLKEKVFPAKEIHFLSLNKDGKQVRVM